VTDHHTFAGGERALASSPRTGRDGVILIRGIEACWKGEHVGLLGKEQISRRVLSADLHDVVLQVSTTASRRSARSPIVIWNHPRDPALEKLPVASGAVQAIEIANGALHGMDLVRWKRQQIVALARKENLALLSGTDRHGWGYAAPNWTLLSLKGWRHLDRDELEARIEGTVRVGGFGATRVVERATADPGTSAAALAFSVFLVPWRMLRALSPEERRMWLVWIWVIAGVALHLRRRRRVPLRGLAAPSSHF
jgi:predicted metal-dependent phosphoesterase TrpH